MLNGMLCLLLLGSQFFDAPSPQWQLVDVTIEAGFTYEHGYLPTYDEQIQCAGGVAVGDVDKDGWEDLYVVRGDIGPNLLFMNRGDGTFREEGSRAHVDVNVGNGSGPLLADLNGDGWLDLFVGGVAGTPVFLFLNNRDGTFSDFTLESGITRLVNTSSATAGDYDRDGDLDLLLSHWFAHESPTHLWCNDGSGRFTAVDRARVPLVDAGAIDYTFTPNFADINGDRWPDILMSADVGTSRVLLNQGDGSFRDVTTLVIDDEYGMGSAIGDYDNDGDLDWFVSSVWDPADLTVGGTGNRLYQNDGDGTFGDATDQAGLRAGDWGWGSSFVDLDNDGHLDLVEVNGWMDEFPTDRTRIFWNNGTGMFVESSAALGVDDTAMGRGLACFDYDRDGDVDVFIANSSGPPTMLRNDAPGDANSISVVLSARAGNTQGIGARVELHHAGGVRTREIRAGSNYVSQNTMGAHFGIGGMTAVDSIVVHWPHDERTVVRNPPLNQITTVQSSVVQGPAPRMVGTAIVKAFPNPFRSGLSIELSGVAPGQHEVVIFDVAGRVVDRFFVEADVPHDWGGTNLNGGSVPSGIYFIAIKANDSFQSHRVTLIR